VVKEDQAEKKRIKDKKERDELERVTSVKIQVSTVSVTLAGKVTNKLST